MKEVDVQHRKQQEASAKAEMDETGHSPD